MSTQTDPLSQPQVPDRVFYANGALLDEEDFTAEQIYHRGRIGRILAYLHGTGTVAGLEVTIEKTEESEILKVSPGLAIDRLGRIIEVPRSACLRLCRWFQDEHNNNYDRLANSCREREVQLEGVVVQLYVVVVDVFIKFEVCERGKQPAFAKGNYDALDAIAPSRLRDSYSLQMVIREEADPKCPDHGFPELTESMTPEDIKKRIIDYKLKEAWKESHIWGPDNTLSLSKEHVLKQQDGTEVLLARLLIPTTDPDNNIQRTTQPVIVDNSLRLFVFSISEVVWLTGILKGEDHE